MSKTRRSLNRPDATTLTRSRIALKGSSSSTSEREIAPHLRETRDLAECGQLDPQRRLELELEQLRGICQIERPHELRMQFAQPAYGRFGAQHACAAPGMQARMRRRNERDRVQAPRARQQRLEVALQVEEIGALACARPIAPAGAARRRSCACPPRGCSDALAVAVRAAGRNTRAVLEQPHAILLPPLVLERSRAAAPATARRA